MSKAVTEYSQQIILDILTKYIDEGVSPDQVTADADFDQLGIDSMDVVEIIFDLEETFDIEIPDPSEIEGMDSSFSKVQDLLNIAKSIIDDKA